MPEYCSEHAPKSYVDVVSKRCKHANCTTRPSYGKEGQQREYCKDHATEGYVNVVSKRCKHPNCTTIPSYGFKGYTPECCATHKTSDMVRYPRKYNIDNPTTCKICATDIRYDEEYCPSCKKFNNLGKTVKAHEKELAIKNLLDAFGVEHIQAEGLAFDPQFHEAVTHEESPEHAPGDIIGVVRQGYRLGDRVIRPALVRVAK